MAKIVSKKTIAVPAPDFVDLTLPSGAVCKVDVTTYEPSHKPVALYLNVEKTAAAGGPFSFFSAGGVLPETGFGMVQLLVDDYWCTVKQKIRQGVSTNKGSVAVLRKNGFVEFHSYGRRIKFVKLLREIPRLFSRPSSILRPDRGAAIGSVGRRRSRSSHPFLFRLLLGSETKSE